MPCAPLSESDTLVTAGRVRGGVRVSGRVRRRLRAAPLLATALLGVALVQAPEAAGCGLDGRAPEGRPARPAAMRTADVLVYGDSITAQVADRLAAALPEAAVDAWSGRRSADAVGALVADLRGRPAPRVVVMAVGTNDTRFPTEVGLLARQVRAQLPEDVRLLWVTAYAEPWPGWQDVNAGVAAVRGVERVGWAERNLAARAGRGGSPLLSDGVHLGCAGAEAWLAMVVASVRSR